MAISNVEEWQDVIDDLVELIEEFGQDMILQERNLKAPNLGSVDFDLEFTKKSDFIGAIDTKQSGKTIFDGSATEQVISQIIYMEYMDGVTSENWILYNNRRIDIIDVENIGELNGVLKLACAEKGTVDNEANKT